MNENINIFLLIVLSSGGHIRKWEIVNDLIQAHVINNFYFYIIVYLRNICL